MKLPHLHVTRPFTEIFIRAFIIASTVYATTVGWPGILDDTMWANQAEYVLTGDVRQFDATRAYGHPGAPIIDGTILVHAVTGISFKRSLLLFLTFFSALIIAGISLLCYFIRPKDLWWLASTLSLSFGAQFLHDYGTPPSVVASLLLVLLSLLTLWIYENNSRVQLTHYLLWGITGGLAAATRADISTLLIIVFLILLWRKTDFQKIFLMGITAIATFTIVNTFMWYMPITHLRDIIGKALYHYAKFEPYNMPLANVFNISSFLIVSILLSLCFLVFRKKLPRVLPYDFLYALYALTTIVYTIFLTADYQATRYFLPIIFIWETFLPLFLFSLVEQVGLPIKIKRLCGSMDTKTVIQICIIIALTSIPFVYFLNTLLTMFIHSYFIDYESLYPPF